MIFLMLLILSILCFKLAEHNGRDYPIVFCIIFLLAIPAWGIVREGMRLEYFCKYQDINREYSRALSFVNRAEALRMSRVVMEEEKRRPYIEFVLDTELPALDSDWRRNQFGNN